jgi:hypothetical protein
MKYSASYASCRLTLAKHGRPEVSVDPVMEWWSLKERLVYTLGRTSAVDATPEIRAACVELLAKLTEAKKPKAGTGK